MLRIMSDNEVNLKRVLRLFRNGIVQHIRERLRAKFGGSAESQLSTLFGKREQGSELTQWERMKLNADRARASPEVSTVVVDDFELLGVSDFFNVFEKFFVELTVAAPAAEDTSVFADRKKGLLRCLQQIKVFRDPNAHDVSESIDADSLMLCILNCKKVSKELQVLKLGEALDVLHKELSTADATKHATLVRISEEVDAFNLSQRCLGLAGASSDSCDSREFASGGRFGSSTSEIRNCVIVVGGVVPASLGADEIDALNAVLSMCERQGQLPVVLMSHRLDEAAVEASLVPAALLAFKRSERMPLFPAYIDATASHLNRLLKPGAPNRNRSHATISITAAEAIHDDKLATMIFSMMRDPLLTAARIVAPFATDFSFGARGAISDAMIDAKKRGCKVCLVTSLTVS